MEVVYLFCESSTVRIPFFDYDKRLFRLLVSQGGSVWNNARREFIFNRRTGGGQFDRTQFGRILSGVPAVWVDDKDAVPLCFFGFWERPWEEAGPVQSVQQIGDNTAMNTESPVLQSINLTDFGPLPLPEKFGKYWHFALEAELRSRKYSPRTRYNYVYFNRLLCRTLQKTPEEVTPEDVTRFLAFVEKDKKYSTSTMNLILSAIKFFYREVLKNQTIDERHRPRQDVRFPCVLSKEEVKKILTMEINPKHRLLLMLVYSSGLRVSEVVALKKEHIDTARKLVYIRLGKGRKDRYTLLSEKAALFLAEYCSSREIKTWLFPGQPATGHLTIRSAQHIFEKAVRRTGIEKKITIHGLRHSFATHLLESGTDIRYIQNLLGHANITTTERYTHVARRKVLSIQSPLDTIF